MGINHLPALDDKRVVVVAAVVGAGRVVPAPTEEVVPEPVVAVPVTAVAGVLGRVPGADAELGAVGRVAELVGEGRVAERHGLLFFDEPGVGLVGFFYQRFGYAGRVLKSQCFFLRCFFLFLLYRFLIDKKMNKTISSMLDTNRIKQINISYSIYDVMLEPSHQFTNENVSQFKTFFISLL